MTEQTATQNTSLDNLIQLLLNEGYENGLSRFRLPGSPQEAPTDIQRLRERQRADQEAHPRRRPLPE